MQLKALLQDDDAVSPVIGVILMVAITVILAAVIASFVLGLGNQQTQNPQASFSWDYQSKDVPNIDDEDGNVKLTHDGGDTIPASELYVRGNGLAKDDNDKHDDKITKNDKKWPKGNASAAMSGESAVTSGNYVHAVVTSKFDISLVWEPSEGDTSATLSSKKGPDA